MNKNLFTFILMIVAAGTIYGQNGTLIAFVNGEAEIDKAFVTDTWPSIQKMALEYKLDPKLQNVEEGVPGAIRITPQLVFQNEYGRSFYVSRYTELDRLKIFLRSVRSTAKIAASNNKSNILIRPLGKSRTTLPLKLTKLTGEVPVGLDHEEFVDKAIKSFKSGFKKFQDGSIDFEPADRAYYVDLHPYISNDGKVYISFEVYSQFNCVVPVISYINDPMVGPFEEYDRVFSALGRRVETLIINYSNSVKNGDGFTPITDQPAVSWTELGLNIQSKQSSTASYKIAALEVDWENPQALDELTPLIQFNFQPPLDSYAGEAMALEGFMSWKSGFLSGEFSIPTRSITMGEKTYDDNVHKKYIKVKKFPKATLRFSSQKVLAKELLDDPGRIYELEGHLNFMGKNQAILLQASFEPFINDMGDQQLIVFAKFQTNIYKTFKVKGPDGPQQAKENMNFQAQFILSPTQTNNDNN